MPPCCDVGTDVVARTQAIEDMCLMVMGRPEEVRHPLLNKLKTAKKLVRFIQESGDRQWASRVSRNDTPPTTLQQQHNLHRQHY